MISMFWLIIEFWFINSYKTHKYVLLRLTNIQLDVTGQVFVSIEAIADFKKKNVNTSIESMDVVFVVVWERYVCLLFYNNYIDDFIAKANHWHCANWSVYFIAIKYCNFSIPFQSSLLKPKYTQFKMLILF